MTRRQPWDLFTVFPAHAGVILVMSLPNFDAESIPRTRGGDPLNVNRLQYLLMYSPHTRG